MPVHVGTSGWSYDHWQGILYPHGAPQKARLDYYIQRYRTVELNSSYYHWPRDATFSGWKERLAPGFLMTVKAPRGLTHSGKLANAETWVPRITRGAGLLGEKVGVLLVQLGPDFGCNYERLARFLELMPRDLKTAVEFRHADWHQDAIFELLERQGAAYCVMSGAHLPCILKATAPFVYVRFHGPDPHHLYGGSYTDDDLRWWTDRIREWEAQGRDVWVYFNNDWEGNAVRNADTLKAFLGV